MSAPLVLFISLLIFMVLKIPIAWSLSLSSIIALFLSGGIPLSVIAQRIFTGADIFSLLAIPFFMLSGEVMVKGGLSKRLVEFANAMVGHLPGGLALVSVVACTFFAAISGSSVATTAAIGGIMIGEMTERGYDKAYSGAVQAIGGTLGIIIPPSIVFIMYGTATNVSIAALLMSGVIPGVFTGIILCVMCYIIAKKENHPRNEGFSYSKLITTFKSAILALLMPVIILGGIYAGVFTPTESAVIAVVYGILISMFVYRSMNLGELKKVIISSAASTANLMILVISAQVFGWFVTYFNVPATVSSAVLSIASNKYIFLLLVNIVLLVFGMFMEVGAITLIMAPILAPMASLYGIDPVHFGLVFVFLLTIGQATPPFGTTLFVACGLTGESVARVGGKLIPFILAEVGCALLFSYVPIISTWLPSILK
ncbi:MAG: TRAP transporter large permease [Tissierellia bacterium]|nr:TRAP transporter large permease [Tissierellia bacterium]